MSYEQLASEQAQPKLADHSAKWRELPLLADTNGQTEQRVRTFCADKRISFESLVELGTRTLSDRNGAVLLAWGYTSGDQVTAIKFRELAEHGKRYTATPSAFLEPLVIGDTGSLDWFLAEGETDACRLYDLVGDVAAVVCLPAGALTFKRSWAARIPRGATVHLCHDADDAGDQGADKAAGIVGGRAVRVRPPEGFKDWCEWSGDRDEFVELVAAARAGIERGYQFQPFERFLEHAYPNAEPLLGEPGNIYLAVGSLLLVYGAEGTGKSTFTVDAIAHLAAGVPWLDIPVARPVRILVIENEGPPSLFQQKLADKAASWAGPDFTGNVHVYQVPWGEFSFATADARAALVDYCDEHGIDLVTANPTLGLGVAASGRPNETQEFVDWLVECGLKTTRAFWLLHHENKAGQISGDWGRHPDTKVQLQRDGNRQRTKLVWEKTRWATLTREQRACMLEWVIDGQGYTVVPLDTVGASDVELEQRLVDYLTEHPLSATRKVWASVKGKNERISKLLDGPRFDCVPGRGTAKLWFVVTSDSPSLGESGNQQSENGLDKGVE
jgi:hypothetical protein